MANSVNRIAFFSFGHRSNPWRRERIGISTSLFEEMFSKIVIHFERTLHFFSFEIHELLPRSNHDFSSS